MKKILKPIPILSCIIVLLLLISISKTKHINNLENINYILSQENVFDISYTNSLEKKIDSLQLEILKYDN
tara:strand:+ start:212 stop:421 length:210 start_codon:yes stop_codon:yes gene_type:complete